MNAAKQITFNDIFKSSFLEKVTSFSLLDMVLAMGLAFVLGLFIFLVYKKTFKGVMYSINFGASLMAMTMVTTFIILAITSNVVLSLGMVGALSIVRFRSAVKEPIDIAFLFWSISVGIVIGAGLIPLAVLGSLFIGLVLIVFVNKKSTDNPYIVLVNMSGDKCEDNVIEFIRGRVSKYVIKSKTVSSGNNIELSVEIRLKNMSTTFINDITKFEGVNNAVLVSYNGEYMS
ncbi:DUF4956 domain-containing protein [Alkaliphilus sp. MSJ-5]|uniref:DUF4956 domain-containing protein n=1 Tax=Alkaliphilus flagellatus TaxID=2841507 RepID=A0ABS6G0V9_9FIRM|nr:DUF4956 domain-containing protein [Alkaliphilus flagellatus]MBU5676131.1 DUF4956 domain-containing protein [Alkaliphilus flagellatus]